MKKILLSILTTIYLFGFSQAPQGINYQAVVRDNQGNELANQLVSVKFNIRQGTAGGTIIYTENQAATTNQFGLITLVIGGNGNLSTIDWANGPYYNEVLIDVTGGTNYQSMGTTQLMSVPYALYAGNGYWSKNGNDIYNNNQRYVGIGTSTPRELLTINGQTAHLNGTKSLYYNDTDSIVHGYVGPGPNSDMSIVSTAASTQWLRFGSNSLIAFWTNGLVDSNNLPEFVMRPPGYMGIGTINPTAKLHVNGQVRIVDGTQGINKVLTSDANGLASWQTSSGSGWSDYAVYNERRVNAVGPQTILTDSAWSIRQINNTEAQVGSSIARSGNTITLQPGTYHISASAQWGLTVAGTGSTLGLEVIARSFLRIADNLNNTLLLGQAEHPSIVFDEDLYAMMQPTPAVHASFPISLEGVITVPSTTTVQLEQYLSYPIINGINCQVYCYTPNAGIPMSIGENEFYTKVRINRIN